jgi:hypothetical protein
LCVAIEQLPRYSTGTGQRNSAKSHNSVRVPLSPPVKIIVIPWAYLRRHTSLTDTESLAYDTVDLTPKEQTALREINAEW